MIRFGVSSEDVVNDWEKIYSQGQSEISPVKFIHETMQTALKYINWKDNFLAGDNTTAILDYCCLFLNKEGEDIREYNEVNNQIKKADWEAEGIAVLDFFFFAWSGLGNLAKDFLELIKENQEQTKLLNTDLSSHLKMAQDTKDLKQSTPKTSKSGKVTESIKS